MAKKLFALMMALMMACSCFVYAEEAVLDGTTEEIQGDVMLISEAPVADTTARVVLEATEPDADGYFTATFTVYNAEVFGIQAAIAYDKEAIVPVDKETKEATDKFNKFATMKAVAADLETGEAIEDWCNTIGNNVDTENGQVTFTLFLSPDKYETANSLVNTDGHIICGENGLVIYEFAFKKISDKDAGLKIGYEVANPDGIILADFESNLSYTFEVKMPESISKVNPDIYTYEYVEKTPITVSDDSPDSAIPMEDRVKIRARNVIFLNINNYGTVSDGTLKWVDKDNKEVRPYIKDDRTMVPLRFIAEELGATVGYDDETRAITVTLGDTVMGLTVDEKAYTLNGEAYEMDCAAEIVADRTFVPVRFVSEALGRSVEWLENQRMVIITTTTYPWDKDNGVEKTLMSEIMLMLTLRDYAYPNAQ